MDSTSRLLAAYDDRLRTDAETAGELDVQRIELLHVATLVGGRGFVTYPNPDQQSADLPKLVPQVMAHFSAQPGITRIEWKTRDHDQVPGLHEALLAAGFSAESPESILIGEARLLAAAIPLPDGVTLRRVTAEAGVREMAALQDRVFGEPVSDTTADAMLRHVAGDSALELWVADHDGRIIGTGRLEPVAGSSFAGVWGGVVDPDWRGRGIYRALTAQRARSALGNGTSMIYSDSTEYSRPILERSGLVKVSTTTPYLWRADSDEPVR